MPGSGPDRREIGRFSTAVCSGGLRDWDRTALRKLPVPTVRVRGPVESNMGEEVRDAVLAGLGISLHSTWHVCDDLKAGRLQVVLPDYRIPESGIYAVMPQRRLMLPRVRAFIDFIAAKFGDVPPWER